MRTSRRCSINSDKKTFSRVFQEALDTELQSVPCPPSMLDQVIIRLMKREDLPALEWDGMYTHFRQVYDNEFQRFETGASVLWVAEIPEKGLIGQVFIQLTCDRLELADGKTRAYLYSFRVRPEYQSQGVGTYMMEIVEADLVRRGFTTVTLNVAKENERAQRLYIRHDFHITAHEPGRWSYPDEKGEWHTVEEPAWRMEKRLPTP
ncbi:MAG: GNAT family N-acetyltransferase [Anaerolineaceae bacterium]